MPRRRRSLLELLFKSVSPCDGTPVAHQGGTVAPAAGPPTPGSKGRRMQARGLVLTAPGQIALQPFDLRPVNADSVRVRIAGCGVCHTDVSFYSGQVRTKHALPLVLGHEIAGTVVEASGRHAQLIGHDVIVPAVIPCGVCDICLAGHDNACTHQFMPGNDADGGFATEIVVPSRGLVVLGPDRGGYALADLSVVADAVTTPYQALERGAVTVGDLVVIIGAGGIGT